MLLRCNSCPTLKIIFAVALCVSLQSRLLAQLHIVVGSEDVTLGWDTIPGHDYQIFRSADVEQWSDLGGPHNAVGTSLMVSVPRQQHQFFNCVDLTLTKGWVAAKTNNNLTDIVAHHSSGVRMGIGTSRDEQGRLGSVTSVSIAPADGGAPLIMAVDSNGRPDWAYGGGEMLFFGDYNDSANTVSITHLDSAGNATSQTLAYTPPAAPIANVSPLEDESGISLSTGLKIASLAVGTLGCIASIAAAAGSGGALAALAVWTCASPALTLASLLIPDDDPAFAYAAAMIDTGSCIFDTDPLSKSLSCASLTINTADVLASEYEAYSDAHEAAVLEALVLQILVGKWTVTSSTHGTQTWTVAANHTFRISGQTLSRSWVSNGANVEFRVPNFDYIGVVLADHTMAGNVYYLGTFNQGNWSAVKQN